MTDRRLAAPLAGIKVLEFSHTVMGPTAGLIFAELGADVVKIEPAPMVTVRADSAGSAPVSSRPSTATSAAWRSTLSARMGSR